jgi:Ca2+-binding EF-hand superfamily protein
MQKVGRMLESALVLTTLTVLAWGASSAQAAIVDAVTETFKQLDADGDGHISAAEAVKAGILAEAFVAGDRDQDGKLSLEEFLSAGMAADKTRQR